MRPTIPGRHWLDLGNAHIRTRPSSVDGSVSIRICQACGGELAQERIKYHWMRLCSWRCFDAALDAQEAKR